MLRVNYVAKQQYETLIVFDQLFLFWEIKAQY